MIRPGRRRALACASALAGTTLLGPMATRAAPPTLSPGERTTVAPNAAIERVAWYDSDRPLRSGWAWGQKYLKDKTAIVGVGLKMGKYPDSTALELATQCYQEALDDAGLKRGDVDGIIVELAVGGQLIASQPHDGRSTPHVHTGDPVTLSWSAAHEYVIG